MLIILCLVFGLDACGNDEVKKEVVPLDNSEFNWKDKLETSDIPDFELRGNLNGKEVRFQYVVYEVWRGSNDNVLNFSLEKAEQKCGYIENYQGFQLISKGSQMNKGEFLKSGFYDESAEFQSFFKYINSNGTSYKSDAAWNCALSIDSLTDNIAAGKIAVCFNDEMKSWIAGRFRAAVCKN